MNGYEYFKSLKLVEGAVWRPAIKSNVGSRASGVRVEHPNINDGGPCIGKYGRFHVFSRVPGKAYELLGAQYWVVDTETKEVRELPKGVTRAYLKGLFTVSE
ncbi:hypothetical protein [Ureibacillus xyleni]|nr:hypothetical protein [Ureibacillus xyleni]